jgi:hypothetical protein
VLTTDVLLCAACYMYKVVMPGLVILLPLQNLEIVEKVKAVAARHDCTPGQIALAWLHAQVPLAVAACDSALPPDVSNLQKPCTLRNVRSHPAW